MDNKYAMVVLSPQNNTADVRQYILKNENDNWEVVMDNLQNEPRVSVAVNRKIPDFNLEMLPNYTISDHKKYLQSGNESVFNALINTKAINTKSDIIYVCNVERFCYVVNKMGFKYIMYKDNDLWTTKEVFNYSEAVDFMNSRTSAAPTFIVWDK